MRRVLITGGAQRLGRALAEGLAGPDCHVAVQYKRSAAEARDLVAALLAHGGKAGAIEVDLADGEAVRGLPARAATLLGGPLDALVNNASMFEYDAPGRMSEAVFAHAMNVNLKAPLLLCEGFAAQAAAGTDNCIVNILDQKLWNPNPDFFSYTLSKYGLLGATRMMAMSFAPKIRVCAIAPGLLYPSFDQTADEFQKTSARNLLGRAIDPAEVARGLKYLLDSRGLTGQILHVDNGQRFVPLERDVMFSLRDEGGE